MSTQTNTITNHINAAPVSANKVIRNTYTLLSLTLMFSGLVAGVSMMLNLPHPGIMLMILCVSYAYVF